jgi:hypothetical protein
LGASGATGSRVIQRIATLSGGDVSHILKSGGAGALATGYPLLAPPAPPDRESFKGLPRYRAATFRTF